MHKEFVNPLDSVEDILLNQDWVFDRPHEDCLSVHVMGKNCHYTMTFIWDEEYGAMKFCCEYDLSLSKKRLDMAARAIQKINARQWLGHFVVNEETLAPCFCHTSLLRGWSQQLNADPIADLIQVALDECEHHYSLFNMLTNAAYVNDSHLSLALMEEQGQA